MLYMNITDERQANNETREFPTWPLAAYLEVDFLASQMLADLSPDVPWDVRKGTAKRLGDCGGVLAVQGLLEHLPSDPFWMVRCAIIQALERIGDPQAIPTLKKVAKNDRFRIVQSYATKAIQRLS
jgi:HEAT repeat protein